MYVQQSDANHYNGIGFRGKQKLRYRTPPSEALVALMKQALKHCVAVVRSKYDVPEKDILADISA